MQTSSTAQMRSRPKGRTLIGPPFGDASATALGWAFLAAVLLHQFGPVDAGRILTTLALAEFTAVLLIAGWDDLLEENASTAETIWQNAVGAVMLRWLVLSVAVVSAYMAGMMPFLASHPISVLGLIGISLLAALLRLTASCRAALSYRPSWLRRGRYILVAVSVLGAGYSDTPNVSLALLLAVLVLLLLLPFSLAGLPSLFRETAVTHLGTDVARRCFLQLGPFLMRNIDLMMVPWLLPPLGAAIFLIARGLACGVSLASDQMQRGAQATIYAVSAQGAESAFFAAAARLNLGLLLVGGGSAIAVMAVANSAQNYLSSDMALLPQVVLWLALGRCDAAIFGAAPLLMEGSTMRRTRATLGWVGALGLALALSFAGVTQVVQMAQYVAIAQLVVGAACAFVLGQRYGIWPGLTALFHKRIKLL